MSTSPKDCWDSSLYEDRHSFVWRAVGDLVALLDARPGERILDLGCGTGQLTAKIAATGAIMTGLDMSASMVAQARQNYPALRFVLGDARDFHFDEPFDAVFSNAVLHWVHQPEAAIRCVADALRKGGRFVLEMGVKGNVARIRRGIEEILAEAGLPVRCPWYYPSAGEYSTLLENAGFEVRTARTFERWTQLEHPERGMREWIEMFAGSYFEGIERAERDRLIGLIEERVRPVTWCDDVWWADYRRLRVEAVKL